MNILKGILASAIVTIAMSSVAGAATHKKLEGKFIAQSDPGVRAPLDVKTTQGKLPLVEAKKQCRSEHPHWNAEKINDCAKEKRDASN